MGLNTKSLNQIYQMGHLMLNILLFFFFISVCLQEVNLYIIKHSDKRMLRIRTKSRKRIVQKCKNMVLKDYQL